jgi:DMSO reductase anchor subunit
MPPDIKKADYWRVRPEAPHWPLVVMTVLTQLSVGAFIAIWRLQLLGVSTGLKILAVGTLSIGALALASSTLHLGRPIHAYRAVKMWKRSWLSREVLLFACFSGMAGLYAVSIWLGLPFSYALGGLTSLFGLAGVTASAFIYLVPARPSWNTSFTIPDFFLTGAFLGPLFVATISAGQGRMLLWIAACAACAQLMNQAIRFLHLIASDTFELQASARLLSTKLKWTLLVRGVLLLIGGIALPLSGFHEARFVAFPIALGGEIIGRYLFYVSVVPKNIAAPYLAVQERAA